ncbi:MAG: hypothetical protein AAF289_18190, partial [Cyanobacteria bacterium P01_A01_bin.135]
AGQTPAEPPENPGSEASESPEQDEAGYLGQIKDDHQVLLQGRLRHPNEDAAWEHGDALLTLVQDPGNFRTVDGDGVYGWELTNAEKDQVLARDYHDSDQRRCEAIAELQQRANDEGLYLLEHILLRPRTQVLPMADTDTDETSDAAQASPALDGFLPIIVTPEDASLPATDPNRLARHDPYSFWVSVILPYWPQRFRNIDFRRFIERSLRLEAPAHVALRIAWINVRQMDEVQSAYREWLEQRMREACGQGACDVTTPLNRLLELLPQLRNVYPQATLHDCDNNRPGDSPILLNRTAIGEAND